MSYKYYRTLAFLLVISLWMSACSDKDDDLPTNTLDQVISARADLSIFNAALKMRGLQIFTQGRGPYTVVAPTNAAFAAFGISNEAALSGVDSNLLTTILSFHIIPDSRRLISIPRGPNATISTQSSGTLYAAKYTNATYINGQMLKESDIEASNGILHVTDVVLGPYSNAFALLSANPDYKLFIQLINRGAANSSFNATTAVTVFAPSNGAFAAAGIDSAAISVMLPATAAAIARYHAVPLRVFGSELRSGQYTTLQGTKLTLVENAGLYKVKGTNNLTPFNITGGNIPASNGVVYFIDGVLKF